MKKLTSTLVIAATILSTLPLMAQQRRLSPHETIWSVVDGNRLSIIYGRPYTIKPGTSQVRKIWGGLVPYDKIWRTGADLATIFITQKPLEMGGTTIPAGVYTLYTLPSENGPTKLIINKQVGQWGLQYDPSQDLARIDMKKATLDTPVNQFTMGISRNPSGGGILKMSWEKTEFSVPFTVKK